MLDYNKINSDLTSQDINMIYIKVAMRSLLINAQDCTIRNTGILNYTEYLAQFREELEAAIKAKLETKISKLLRETFASIHKKAEEEATSIVTAEYNIVKEDAYRRTRLLQVFANISSSKAEVERAVDDLLRGDKCFITYLKSMRIASTNLTTFVSAKGLHSDIGEEFKNGRHHLLLEALVMKNLQHNFDTIFQSEKNRLNSLFTFDSTLTLNINLSLSPAIANANLDKENSRQITQQLLISQQIPETRQYSFEKH